MSAFAKSGFLALSSATLLPLLSAFLVLSSPLLTFSLSSAGTTPAFALFVFLLLLLHFKQPSFTGHLVMASFLFVYQAGCQHTLQSTLESACASFRRYVKSGGDIFHYLFCGGTFFRSETKDGTLNHHFHRG